MGITTIYKCDNCSHEQDTSEQMWKLFIGYEHCATFTQYPTKQKEQMWCRKCMEKHDLLSGKENPKQQTPPIAPPSLEDIIREMMREEISSITGAC